MLTTFKRVLTPNVIPRSIRYYRKVKLINKAERNHLSTKNRRKDLCDALETVLGTRTCLTVDEWKEFRSKAETQKIMFNDKDILNAIKSLNNPKDPLKIAESFVQAFDIDRDVTVNGTFIDLYAAKAAEGKLTQTEEDNLIKICNELLEKGSYFFRRVCNGFCATKEWKRILEFPKWHESPVTVNLVIRKALHENESKLAWELIENLTSHYPNELHEKTIEKYFHFSAKNNTQTAEYVEKMLRLLERDERILSEPVAKGLIDILMGANCEANQIRMDFSGTCPNCAKSLAQSTITAEEFALVTKNFEKKVVRGEDIYLKTTPTEWNAFKELIEKIGPFDIVVDGLNVAFHSHKKKQCSDANKLIDIVARLEEDGKRVLVIGKKLMEQWQGMERLETLSSNIFLVENVSKDDIFLLYGAMYSGPNAYILTNDYMRDHKHSMGPEYKSLFKKWQHQSTLSFYFDENGQFHTMEPMKFKWFCHQSDDHWHVPFIGDDERNQFNEYTLPKNWICLRL